MTEYLDSSLIKKNIDNQGYHCIDDYISDEELNKLKEFVNKKLEENNNQYFFLTSENPEKTLLNDKKFFKKIEDLLKKITNDFNFKTRENEDLYKVLRVVTGEKSKIAGTSCP